jgi:hypothetical protein
MWCFVAVFLILRTCWLIVYACICLDTRTVLKFLCYTKPLLFTSELCLTCSYTYVWLHLLCACVCGLWLVRY